MCNQSSHRISEMVSDWAKVDIYLFI